MVYFNVLGLCGETFTHIRVYQKAKYNVIKEGTSFKFSNLVKKDEELYWATASSVIAYTSIVEVNEDTEKNPPSLREERPIGGLEQDLKGALNSPEKSTITGKVVMVSFSKIFEKKFLLLFLMRFYLYNLPYKCKTNKWNGY